MKVISFVSFIGVFSQLKTMDYSSDLPSGYVYATVKCDADEGSTCIRCNLYTADDWISWLAKFEDLSSQKFIVKRTYSEPVR